jgi:hypothetical protein
MWLRIKERLCNIKKMKKDIIKRNGYELSHYRESTHDNTNLDKSITCTSMKLD